MLKKTCKLAKKNGETSLYATLQKKINPSAKPSCSRCLAFQISMCWVSGAMHEVGGIRWCVKCRGHESGVAETVSENARGRLLRQASSNRTRPWAPTQTPPGSQEPDPALFGSRLHPCRH